MRKVRVCIDDEYMIYMFLSSAYHDGVIEWKHFPLCWPFVRGIHRSPANSPHKGQWRGDSMFSLICAWINIWVNNGEAQYDVKVMTMLSIGTSGLFSTVNWRVIKKEQLVWIERFILVMKTTSSVPTHKSLAMDIPVIPEHPVMAISLSLCLV